MRILDRYLIRELVGPFFFGLLAFTMIFVAGPILVRITQAMAEQGLSLGKASLLFLYLLPRYLVLTFPMATLLGIIITFGRLSSESELIAMFAGGASFRRIMVPVVIFGLGVSLLTVAFNEEVVPAANAAAERIASDYAGRDNVVLRQMNGEEIGRLLYAERLDVRTGQMDGVTLLEFRGGQPSYLLTARQARWQGDMWVFYDGSSGNVSPQGPALTVRFRESRARLLDPPKALAAEARDPGEMTYRELKEQIERLSRQKIKISSYVVTLYQKISIPFASLVFALIGAPLGLRSPRGGSAIGLGLTMLIIFGYYVIWHYLSVLAQQDALSPFLAAWLPNWITGALGVGLVLTARH
jgi:lipopolysaccharide export system permease protein